MTTVLPDPLAPLRPSLLAQAERALATSLAALQPDRTDAVALVATADGDRKALRAAYLHKGEHWRFEGFVGGEVADDDFDWSTGATLVLAWGGKKPRPLSPRTLDVSGNEITGP